jgi:thioredoxin-related protein
MSGLIQNICRIFAIFLCAWFGLIGSANAANVGAGIASGTDDVWHDDVEKAVEIAKAENKLLLLDFTGSDWCPPCIKLDEEIFSKEEFTKAASEHFVLVKLDFPNAIELPEKIKQQNADWAKKYSVQGYPTVFLIDSQGKPFGILGYQEGGVQPFLENLQSLRQAKDRFDAAMKSAAEKEGLEKAVALDQAISELDEDIINVYYEGVVKEIVDLDVEDQAGLRTKWFAAQDAEARKILMVDIVTVSRLEDPNQAIAYIDAAIEKIKLPVAMQLDILKLKLDLLIKSEKISEADALIESMIATEGVGPQTQQKLIVKKALTLVGVGRKDEAIKYLEDQIQSRPENVYLLVARGELYQNDGQFKNAIETYDRAAPAAATNPDLMIEIVGSKADALTSQNDVNAAIALLDNFATDENWPTDLRSEAYLQKAMILREQGRTGPALRAENDAINIAAAGQEKANVEKLTEQLRTKFQDK